MTLTIVQINAMPSSHLDKNFSIYDPSRHDTSSGSKTFGFPEPGSLWISTLQRVKTDFTLEFIGLPDDFKY